MTDKIITFDDIKSWEPCYCPSQYLDKDWEGTVIDILEHKKIHVQDKLWIVCRSVLIDTKILRLFAVWCVRQVQHLTTDDRSIKAIDVAERYANGLATLTELNAAWDDAWAAVIKAGSYTSWVGRAAARAVSEVPRDAALATAGDSARAVNPTTKAAARDAQLKKLIEMVKQNDLQKQTV